MIVLVIVILIAYIVYLHIAIHELQRKAEKIERDATKVQLVVKELCGIFKEYIKINN